MRQSFLSVCAVLVGLASASVMAAEPPVVLDLWPAAAPGEPSGVGEETSIVGKPEEKGTVTRVGNVTKPTLTIYRPAADKDSGTSVIICPGGGYNILAWDLEGTEIAEWLNSIGVTGIVLKYRVPRRPNAPKDEEQPVCSHQDAQRAMRLVRSKAAEWKLDDKKIGILGFSAGGHLAARTSTNYETLSYPAIDDADKLSGRPDFTILIYPAYLVTKDMTALTPMIAVNDKTPPAFLAHAYDDGVTADSSVQYFLALKRNKVPAELHVYSKGGHGYGMRPSPNVVVTWPKRCEEWMRASELVK